ncbi:MAG: DHH family phosphoesterase [Bacilli bacterium]|nr:DHH family phosphoesterase [Bacilli bacterium]
MEVIKNFKINLDQKILQSGNIVIVPHNGIDFDAIGSAIGISLVVKKLKKAPFILIDDPVYKIDHGVQLIIDEIKNNFPIITKEKYSQIATPQDLFVLTDVNKSHMICLKDEVKNKDNVVIIDHHDEDESTLGSNCKYINSDISSASEIVTKLLNLYKIKPSSDVANYLLAGIYLDTNKLTKNISSETMKTVATLLDCGANMNVVTDLFAEDFNSDRRVQELVSKAKIITYSIALILADEGVEYTKEELAKAADYLLKYKVDAAFSIGNIGDNTISISARSKDKINVGSIMQALNGGGNQHSAATKLENTTVEEANKKLLKIIKPIIL